MHVSERGMIVRTNRPFDWGATLELGVRFHIHSWDEPGEAFATEANPVQRMQVGLHYIRLHVVNDVVQTQVESDDFGVLFEEVNSFDFVEIEIEIVE